MLAFSAQAQQAQNRPYADDKLFHFGFQLGLNFASFGVTDSEMKQALAEYMSDEVIGSFCEGFFKTDGVRLLCAAAPKEAPLYVMGRVELAEDGALYAVCYSETEDGFYIPAFFSFTVKNSKLNTITQIVEETQE